MKNLKINMSDIGYGADKLGVASGYVTIQEYKPKLAKKINYIQHQPLAENRPKTKVKNYNTIYKACLDLYNANVEAFKDGYTPISIGGDHSLALGSVKASMQSNDKPIGLIWIDAHADINRFTETESGNVHGTPVASLMGINEEHYNNLGNEKRILPENLVYVATRSVDYPEQVTILEKNIFEIKDALIKATSFEQQVDNLVAHLKDKVEKVHISLDLDSIDPNVIKGVSTPVENGLTTKQVIDLFKRINKEFEIASIDIYEFNPLNDSDFATIDYVEELVDVIENM